MSESKNIPKNYGKAILNFIQRQDQLRGRVLRRLGVEEGEFL
jgi:hypothetical protein